MYVVVKEDLQQDIVQRINTYLESLQDENSTKTKTIWTRIDDNTDQLLKYLRDTYNIPLSKIIRKGIILYLKDVKADNV